MKLTAIEIDSALWRKIEAELTERLSSLRIQNDGDRTHEETAKLRGRISEAKNMLDWAKPDPQITGD
jgi:hypothetical protein